MSQIWQSRWATNSALDLQLVSLRGGVVEAGGVGGGVGVVELHEAVGVGQDAAEVEPVEEVGTGFDVEALAGGALRLQDHGAVRAALHGDGRVFDGYDFRPTCCRGVI